MVRRNQRQAKTITASREHRVVGDQATPELDGTVPTSVDAVCKDVERGNSAVQSNIHTEGNMAKDCPPPPEVNRDKENLAPPEDGDVSSHVISDLTTSSDSGSGETIPRTLSAPASHEPSSASGDASVLTAANGRGPMRCLVNARDEDTLQPEGEATSQSRSDDSGASAGRTITGEPEAITSQIGTSGRDSELGDGRLLTASETTLGRGYRFKKPSLRAQEAAHAAEKQVKTKKKARVQRTQPSIQESKKRKCGSTELEEMNDRDKKQRKLASEGESQQRATYSISALIRALTVGYFDVLETAKLWDAAQGLAQMSERSIVSPEPRHAHAPIGELAVGYFDDSERAKLREDAALGLLEMSERPRVFPKGPRHVDAE